MLDDDLKHSGWFGGSSAMTDLGFFQLDEEMKTVQPGLPDIQIHLYTTLFEYEPEEYLNMITMKPYINEAIIDQHRQLNGRQGFSLLVNMAHPRSKGTVRLNITNPFGYPIIDPRYLVDPYDVKILTQGIRLAQRLWNTNAMQAIDVDPHADKRKHPLCKKQHVYDSDDYWECVIRGAALTVYHHTSTCKMGASNDPTAVLDPQLRVKGVERLRVADASIMPSVTSGNTNAPTIMIGEKAAYLIRGIDSVKHFRNKVKNI